MTDKLKEAVEECRSAIEWAENGEDDQMAKDDALFPALRTVLDALEEAREYKAMHSGSSAAYRRRPTPSERITATQGGATAALIDRVDREAREEAELQRDNVAMMLCRVLLKTTSSGDKLATDSIDLMRRMDCMPSILRQQSSLEKGLRDALGKAVAAAPPPRRNDDE